jgi:hypothetical protein
MSQRQSFIEALGKDMADLLWTANTLQVYPATPQNFSVGSLLPAVIYMFRRGFRRGPGKFAEAFSPSGKGKPNIWCIAGKLSLSNRFEGFNSESAKDILGDLLLADALENKGGAEGHSSEVQRAFPAHYYSSWLDLPVAVGNLRFVPEMLVSLLANQSEGITVAVSGEEKFSVGKKPTQNPLLRVFAKGVIYGENAAVLAGNEADRINEAEDFSVEEWLMVQLGRTCGQAPEKMTKAMGADAFISSNQPLARGAASIFREDMASLLISYGTTIPRRGLSPMLECLIGLGLWHTFLTSLNAVVRWERTHELPNLEISSPFQMFTDASNGTDTRLRDLAEASGFELVRFINEATNALAVVRVLDAAARNNRRLREYVPNARQIQGWLSLLGEVRNGNHAASDSMLDGLAEKCSLLLNKLEQKGDEPEACNVLRSSLATNDPARALAEALTLAMGSKILQTKYFMYLDSAGMANEPHGLLKKRRFSRRLESGKTQRGDARSVVLSNGLLDTLVHTQLAKKSGGVSFRDFLQTLKTDYGILIDDAPAGVAADREDLLRNRNILEKRLRDLGLLAGVNDAESMKRLRSRYRATESSQRS